MRILLAPLSLREIIMKHELLRRLLSGAALAMFATTVHAQTVSTTQAEKKDTVHLEAINVEATQSAVEQAQQKLDQRAGGTSVVDAEDFEDTRATTLSDVLKYAPGVFAETRHGEETRLSIRGSGIQRGFLLRGIQLYQDGIPLNFADGAGDFQEIDPLSMQYAEVWRGGNGLEYGASALGGAINFVTPTGRTAETLEARVDAGSFGQRRGHFQLAGAHEDLDGVVSFTAGKQDGWRDHSATSGRRVSANAGLRVSDTFETRLFLKYVDSELEIPGALTLAQFNADPEQALTNSEALNASNDYQLGRAAIRFSWAPREGIDLTSTAHYSKKNRYHPTVRGLLKQKADNTGLDLRGVFDFAEGDAARRVVAGISAARYIGQEDRFTNAGGHPGTFNGRTELDGQTYSAYAEYSHGLTDALTVQAGTQFTVAKRELDNLATPANSYDETFEGWSPKLGALYDLDTANQLFANVSRSFEPSPFGEARVLPDLPLPDAQEADTVELGWRHRSGKAAFEATAYYSIVDNEFLALVDENGVSLGTTNADRTIHRGLEVGGSYAFTPEVVFRASYLWNDFRFDDDISFGDNDIAGIPDHSLNAQLAWSPASWVTVTPKVELRGRTWIDHANTSEAAGFALLHLGLSGALPGEVEWFLDLRNLTDKEYIAGTLVRDNVNGADSASFFPGDPRSVFGGLKVTF
ncbi:TonB-dependent receptor [Hwanghaeella grinnelliae]|uniref:TonB-dependent receptor n=1 Tax=Hwanghaeella grinnelliae TaxID=2500179 RepID=A0A437QYI5_9PROT|nr:TonB-dependent receptor [Hwanghaeella grinnelliae]RVU39562.1 TonB-dependent receptor [Hwanghaeella grinnelliae]